MSGGYWDYNDTAFASSIFGGLGYCIDYGDEGREHSAEARKSNPLEDREFSEMVFDMLCVLHSFDWYKSGDTSEEQYRDDLIKFKNKWLSRSPGARTKMEIDKSISELKDELYDMFGVESIVSENAVKHNSNGYCYYITGDEIERFREKCCPLCSDTSCDGNKKLSQCDRWLAFAEGAELLPVSDPDGDY